MPEKPGIVALWAGTMSGERTEQGRGTNGPMATEPTRAARQQIETLFQVGTFAGAADGELLERFVEGSRSTASAAFTVLVQRHGPMVLDLCQRILRDTHEAEDAAQAAFLVLARRARAIRRKDSVGSWLFGVAVRVAQRARARAARRRYHEQRRAEMNPGAHGNHPADGDASWSVDLHVELAHLPESLRAPLILCYFEGLTNDQAAERLGLSLRTLRRRLALGRERIKGRLARRGIIPSPSLLGPAFLSEPARIAGPPPSVWVERTVASAFDFLNGQGAAGAASSAVLTLAREVLRSMSRSKLLPAATAILLTALAGAGLTLAAIDAPDPVTVETIVEAPEPTRPGPVVAAIETVTTPEPMPQQGRVDNQDAGQREDETVRVPILGRVVDERGRPVAGATLHILRLAGLQKNGGLDPWLESIRSGEPYWRASRHFDPGFLGFPEGYPREVTTDAEGHFRFEPLPADAVAGLSLSGPSVAFTELNILTRAMEPIQAKGFESRYGSQAEKTVYGSNECTIVATPSRPIEGLIRDARTGAPLAGVEIRSSLFRGAQIYGVEDLKATSDAEGRFRLDGMPQGDGNVLLVVPGDDLPYFMREVKVPGPPEVGPVTFHIDLHRGLWIEGTVTSKSTGKPIEGARLHYLPFRDNPFAGALPEFDGPTVDGDQDRYRTRADGTYRLVGLAGRAIVGADHGRESYLNGVGSESIAGIDNRGHFDTWNNPIEAGKSWPNAMKEINPAEGTESVRVDLEFDPGGTLRVDVVGPDGEPVPDLQVLGRTSTSASYVEKVAGSSFEVTQLRAGEARTVLVRHDGLGLGKVARVRLDDEADGPVVLALEPLAAIAGRVIEPPGVPIQGARIRISVAPSQDFAVRLPLVFTDNDGRFRADDVPAGCDYDLVVERHDGTHARDITGTHASVRPGETTDLGEVRFPD